MAVTPSLSRFRVLWPVLALWSLLAIQVVRRPQSFAFAWDTFGYHLYLPAALIHADPLIKDMGWVEAVHGKYRASSTLYQLSTMPNGARVVRYPVGLSIAWSPWFLVGHVAAKISGHEQDGFSKPYQLAVTWGMMLYFLIGLLVLRSVLARLFSDRVALFTILLVVLGTNLLEQSLGGQTMPHLTLFSLYALILHFTLRWRSSGAMKDAAATGFFIGLAALIRPTEIVSVIIPLLWPSADGLGVWRRMVSQRRQWFVMGMIMFLIGSVQFVYWKLAAGSWFVDSYANPGEGLDLLYPHTLPFLFSFRKGWFLYTPLMAVATIAIIFLWRRGSVASLPVTVFFLVNLYLVSSWTCWWYADSFSSRAMLGSYAVMAIPLGQLMVHVLSRRTLASAAALVGLVAIACFNIFQFWQFSAGLIHSSRMTKEAYMAVFCRTVRPPDFDDLLLVDRTPNGNSMSRPDRYVPTRALGLLAQPLFWAPSHGFDTLAVMALPMEAVDKDRVFTQANNFTYAQLTERDHAYLEVRWFVKPLEDDLEAAFVCTFEHNGSYGYRTYDLRDLGVVRGTWNPVSLFYLTPEIRNAKDTFTTYLWSFHGTRMMVTGPLVIVHELKPRG